jgi:acylphosphatase
LTESRAVSVRISGSVQGVGYRLFVLRVADSLELSGWVSNERDGSVAAYAEGPPDLLDAFVERLREGPRAARVEHIEISRVPPEGLSGFTIR